MSAQVPVISTNQNTAARVRWIPPNVAQKEQGLAQQILNDPLVLKIQAGKLLTRLEYSQLTRTLGESLDREEAPNPVITELES